MERLKRVAKAIPRGRYPDSRDENRAYWLSRPPAERIAAAKRLRRKIHRLFRRQELPPLARVVRPFRPGA